MNDKGQERLDEGFLARKDRALQSIQEILGLNKQTYRDWLDGMTPEELSAHDHEVGRYMKLCTIMYAEHIQWSSQLLLAAPEVSPGKGQSSYIGPLGKSLQGAIKDGKPLAQHLRDAADQISKLNGARRRFLVELFDLLRPEEQRDYGDLLRDCEAVLSALPNIKLWDTLERLDLCWKFRYEEINDLMEHVPVFDGMAEAKWRHQRVTDKSNQAVRHILKDVKASSDSLAAKLMLASMINRYHWEFLELERFEDVAVPSLLRLVEGLHLAGNSRIPADLQEEAFRDWMMNHLSGPTFGEEHDWRPLKPAHLNRVYAQAKWILSWERIDFVRHDASENELQNICALNLAWSYCTREKHDIRIADIKDYDLVNLREIQTGEQVPLTRIKYQQRQLNTMLRSLQHQALDPEKIRMQTESNRDLRTHRMQFIRANFKETTLSQWKVLTTGVFKIVFPQLCRF
ncbi:hypothetical protein V2I68_19275 [Pseudomonas viridiflava]|uniref:Uncharacterized protein n=1 Tax=Pseudomonas viridiflava TaxID=33069 RepID=A0ABU7NC62_PSEVI|nr:hypothetical protein [Pseudomonas viridiflava]MEE4042498.1 hypothetical protein [Pseudomonas viridiflava]MEE4062468.1 hypothetical protein [Pseudomonas viridiflava]MEE4171848.1 hypothetical protein [Pseudomonas viridiflava]